MARYSNRRSLVIGIASMATLATAGCSSNGDGGGQSGGGNGGGGSVPSEVESYLSEVENFDGTAADLTGQSEASVTVGTEANGGNFGFGPAAIRVDSGTTVVWEWNGKGSQHNVVHDGGEFESDMTDEEGHTFDYTFDSSGNYLYYCAPHEALGMKGAVIVE